MSMRNPIVICIFLAATMVLTRSHHFGGAYAFPDASLAAFLLGGIWLGRFRYMAFMMTVAFAVDYWVIAFGGISGFCVTPAYFGLIPTYAAVWFAGHILSASPNPFAWKRFFSVAALSMTLAFVISNGFWYAFSGYFPDTGLMQFSGSVAQYYLPYVGYPLLYLSFAWAAHHALHLENGVSSV